MKKILLAAIVIALLAALGVWYFVFYKPTHQRRSVNNETAIVIKAPDLIQQFIANESNANSLYLNKAVEVSGTVNTIDTVDNNVIINLTENNGSISVRLKETTTIANGNGVVVKGFVTGFVENQVQLNEALVISNNSKQVTVNTIDTLKKDTIVTTKKDTATAVTIYKTNTGTIKFFSKAPAENIEAINKQVIASINTVTGDVLFTALIKGFRFENELMQEHFNGADYMNSNQFPKAIFKGKIQNNTVINYAKNGVYKTSVVGNLTIHGITKPVTTVAELTIKNNKMLATAVFNITFKDYQVASWDDNATAAQVTINAALQP